MTQERIKKAADDFADKEYEISDIDRDPLYKGFYHGAQWRINSVWHTINEDPGYGKHILVHFRSGNFALWFARAYILSVFKRFKVEEWAYVRDLLPADSE